MVSQINSKSNELMDSANTPATSPSLSTNSFSQQLVDALESYMGQSGMSQFEINIQPAQGQNSDTGQFLVTITPQSAAAPAGSSAKSVVNTSSQAPAQTTVNADSGSASSTGGSLPLAMQNFARDWSVLTPQQMAFQLANATGGSEPSALVPGTSMAFSDLTQTQQLAYQYALNFGTGGTSMQDFLTQNAGAQSAWNLSNNEIQADGEIRAAANTSYTAPADGSYKPIQAPAYQAPTIGGNLDNLPNPAMIKYLPQDQQAAAWAAVDAEGVYGTNAKAAALSYAAS